VSWLAGFVEADQESEEIALHLAEVGEGEVPGAGELAEAHDGGAGRQRLERHELLRVERRRLVDGAAQDERRDRDGAEELRRERRGGRVRADGAHARGGGSAQ